jgi:hypothetical protein
MISRAPEAEDACPHCSPKHGDPDTCSWGVWVNNERDGDGQPLRLSVAKSDGAHVAESDAEWLREILREHDARRVRSRDREPLTYNENTLFKVKQALEEAAGLNGQQVIDCIALMQNAGIYFREKAENLS